jgi:hypothetical protein
MLKKSKLLLCLTFAVVLTACGGSPKLDTSTPETTQASLAKILESLPQEKQLEFLRAQTALAASILSAASLNGPEAILSATEDLNKQLNGKTADEIIEMANKAGK